MSRRGLGHLAAAMVLVAGAGLVAGCESEEQKATEAVADQMSVCAKDASAVGLPGDYPAAARLPDGFVVTHVDKRQGARTVLTAVSPKPFADTLKAMQARFSSGGWTLSQGEVEARDAESNFAGNGMKGRWAIRAMDSCKDNTAVSIVTGTAG